MGRTEPSALGNGVGVVARSGLGQGRPEVREGRELVVVYLLVVGVGVSKVVGDGLAAAVESEACQCLGIRLVESDATFLGVEFGRCG